MSAQSLYHREDVEGKIVVDSNGRTIGKAKDIAFSLDGTLTIVVGTQDNSEARIPFSQVMGLSDFIVLKPDSQVPVANAASTGNRTVRTMTQGLSQVCTSCRSTLRPGAKFCGQCGAPTA